MEYSKNNNSKNNNSNNVNISNRSSKKKTNNNSISIQNYIPLKKKKEYNEIIPTNLLKKLDTNTKSIYKNVIGLYDPLGENINPLTGEPYQNLYKDEKMTIKDGPLKGKILSKTYANLSYIWTRVKMYEHITEMIQAVRENQIVLIAAGTGVGKTVIIPKIPLQAFFYQSRVICTNPKKLVTRKNAVFAAECLDVKIGNEVGYYYKGTNLTSNKTKLTFTTPGSLKSKLTGGDPYLMDYDCVILDEIHERSVETDQLLLMMKEILRKRPEFKLILMSATISLEVFRNYYSKEFKYKELNYGTETLKKIDLFYEKKDVPDLIQAAYITAKKILLGNVEEERNILIFIKAPGDGNKIKEMIERDSELRSLLKVYCVILASGTSNEDQDYATSENSYKEHPMGPYNRKVVLSTNVAESAITVDGVDYVIDLGNALESSFEPNTEVRTLFEEPISKASADQRKGRVGRTRDGVCYRLYTEKKYNELEPYPIPIIQKSDISNDILDFMNLEYIHNVKDLKMILQQLISPPSIDYIESALRKLYLLGALTDMSDKGTLTILGRGLSKFRGIPLEKAISIIASYFYNVSNEVMIMFLITLEIDGRMENIFERYRPRSKSKTETELKKEKKELENKQKHFHHPLGDYFTCLNIYESLIKFVRNEKNKNPNLVSYRETARKWCVDNGIQPQRFVERKGRDDWDKIKNQKYRLSDSFLKCLKVISDSNKQKGGGNITNNNNNNNNKNNVITEENRYRLQKLNRRDKIQKVLPFLVDDPSFYKNDRILYSLLCGGILKTAIQMPKSKTIYQTIYPKIKIKGEFDKNSTVSSRSKIILYDEIFQMRKGQKLLKYNMITKIGDSIITQLKKMYPSYNTVVKNALKSGSHNKRNNTKVHKSTYKSTYKPTYKSKQKLIHKSKQKSILKSKQKSKK